MLATPSTAHTVTPGCYGADEHERRKATSRRDAGRTRPNNNPAKEPGEAPARPEAKVRIGRSAAEGVGGGPGGGTGDHEWVGP